MRKYPLIMGKEKKKKGGIRKRIDKLFLGVIVGGAVGSILGLTLAPKSGKETRKFLSDKTKDFHKKIQATLQGPQTKREEKKGFWHFLHKLFVRKK